MYRRLELWLVGIVFFYGIYCGGCLLNSIVGFWGLEEEKEKEKNEDKKDKEEGEGKREEKRRERGREGGDRKEKRKFWILFLVNLRLMYEKKILFGIFVINMIRKIFC